MNGTKNCVFKQETPSMNVLIKPKMETNLDAQINYMLLRCGVLQTLEEFTHIKEGRNRLIERFMMSIGSTKLIKKSKLSQLVIIKWLE